MKRPTALALAAIVMMSVMLAGCKPGEKTVEKNDGAEDDRIEIAMSFDSFVIERWQRDRDVFVSTAKELGATVNVQNANGDVEKQKEQIEYFIKKGVDAIVIVCIDSDSLKETVQKAKDEGIKIIAYDRLVTNANADLYDVIQNPFGTQDATRMELKDLPEDHPAFGAIRFLFENGFMPAKEDGRILPDEEGTLGDLASALFAALGLGTADDPATAAATLAQYGILPADASPEAPLTWGMYDQVMSGLAAIIGQELPMVSTPSRRSKTILPCGLHDNTVTGFSPFLSQ